MRRRHPIVVGVASTGTAGSGVSGGVAVRVGTTGGPSGTVVGAPGRVVVVGVVVVGVVVVGVVVVGAGGGQSTVTVAPPENAPSGPSVTERTSTGPSVSGSCTCTSAFGSASTSGTTTTDDPEASVSVVP